MNDRALTDLHSVLQPLAQQFLNTCNQALNTQGYKVFIDQTFRSWTDQDADYAKGRTAAGPRITDAQAGQSPHNVTDDGTATGNPAAVGFDFAIEGPSGALDWDASDPIWKQAIAIGEGLGLISGSCFPNLQDNPHFELANWRQYIAS